MKTLKDLLYEKGIKQVELVRKLKLDPGRISLHVNGLRPLPEKYQVEMAKILEISLEELKALSGFEVSE